MACLPEADGVGSFVVGGELLTGDGINRHVGSLHRSGGSQRNRRGAGRTGCDLGILASGLVPPSTETPTVTSVSVAPPQFMTVTSTVGSVLAAIVVVVSGLSVVPSTVTDEAGSIPVPWVNRHQVPSYWWSRKRRRARR